MKKNKKYDKANVVACIGIFFTFVMIVAVTIYSYVDKKNIVVQIILLSLLAISFLVTLISVIKFMSGTPRLKNK